MLSDQIIQQLLLDAKTSSRKRAHLLLHENHEALLHRLVIALSKGTYIKPHNHYVTEKEEVLFVLKGEVCVVYFNDTGEVMDKQIKTAGEVNAYGEHDAKAWHTLFPLTEDAVIIEIKRGPFIPTSEQEFAAWAPNEGDSETIRFLNWLDSCQVGDSYTSFEE